MSNTTHGEISTLDGATPVQSNQVTQDVPSDGLKKHFDTFETNFFQEGDSVSFLVEADQFDDLDGTKHFFSRKALSGVAVLSTCVAILACIALWRSNSRTSSPVASGRFSAASSPMRATAPVPTPLRVATPTSPAEPTTAQGLAGPPALSEAESVPTSAPEAAHAEPGLYAPAPAQANSNSASKAEVPPVVTAAAVQAAQAVAVAPAPPVELPAMVKNEVIPAATPAGPPPAKLAPPAALEQPPRNSPDKLDAVAAAEAQAVADDDARSRCKEAIGSRHNKEVLQICPNAFVKDPSAADIAVALARIEFDRGRSAQASAWSKKAIEANPDAADAYVFIGGAEQSAGHGKAAKEAYAHYLRLAPSGRYAADLRAIVNSL